jgi:uncharacterized phage protein gp47/JayE
MAYSIPTFRELLSRVQTDLGQYSDGTTPPASVEYVLARAIADVARGLYGYQTYLLKQAFPDTADETNFWHWFQIFGLTRKSGTALQATVDFTGTNGVDVEAGYQVQRSDGTLYTVLATVTISGGTATATVLADAVGLDTLTAGDTVTMAAPVTGIDSAATVNEVTVDGVDLETLAAAKTRLISYLSTPPHGGGEGDYVRWCLEVGGVTRAWEYALLAGPNSVSVAFVRDGDGSGAAIIPSAGERTAVQTYLDTVRPITVAVDVIPIVSAPLNITLTALSPDTSEVRAAITESVTDWLERDAEPGGTLLISQLREAISTAAGEVNHVMSVPAADVTHTYDQMPILGTITWPI